MTMTTADQGRPRSGCVIPYCPAWQPGPKPKASRSNSLDYRLPPGRLCHDCQQPTSNYRCDDCLSKWRHKHNVSDDLL